MCHIENKIVNKKIIDNEKQLTEIKQIFENVS